MRFAFYVSWSRRNKELQIWQMVAESKKRTLIAQINTDNVSAGRKRGNGLRWTKKRTTNSE